MVSEWCGDKAHAALKTRVAAKKKHLHHDGRLVSPYVLLPIIFSMNDIYRKPMIWTFRVCLGDQMVSRNRSNILFSRRDIHFGVYTGPWLLEKPVVN